jgi:hypothetical protein
MMKSTILKRSARQAQRAPQGQSRRRAEARGDPASHVDRRNRVQLVEEAGCRVARIRRSQGSRTTAGLDVSAGTVAVVRSPDFLRALTQRDRACNIDPPASSYAIMRRARPYRGENSGPGKDFAESLTPRPEIREHNRGNSGRCISRPRQTPTLLTAVTHEHRGGMSIRM